MVSLLLFAFSIAPPSRSTGGFGEGDCTVCHTTFPLNSGLGEVTITAPEFYTSGDTFPISVTVSDSVAKAWGFELSARTNPGGQQAGNLIPGTDGRSQLLSSSNGIQYIGHTVLGVRLGTTGGVSFDFMWQAPDVSFGPVIFHAAGDGANGNGTNAGDNIYTKFATSQPQISTTYYFPHIALGGGWQTTFTYINYRTQAVTCETSFFSDSGDPLVVPFGGMADSKRTDNIPPGGSIHEETADLNAAVVTGWAQAQCSGPIQASALFRFSQDGVPQSEASVIAMTGLASQFVTFADQDTGVAYANPSTEIATITFTGKDAQGTIAGMPPIMLGAGEHGATNLRDLPGLESFTGSVTITSLVPIISLSLNFEAAPVFSSLPPGQVDGNSPTETNPVQYLFPHIALGAGWQTTFTYINYLTQAVTCETYFFSDSGDPLLVPFGGTAISERTDIIPPGGSIHEETAADLNAPLVAGWAQAICSGPIQASALFRFYQGGVPQSEASVIAMTSLASEFVTFADQDAGVAYANPSAEMATIIFIGKDIQGTIVGMPPIMLGAGEHGATNLRDLPGLESFTGSVTITSSAPIISLSLNFEAAPVFSSLPPGQLNEIAPPPPPGEPPSEEPPPEEPPIPGY